VNKTIGIALIVLGLFGLAWGGFTYTTTEKVVDIGPIHATREQTHNVPLLSTPVENSPFGRSKNPHPKGLRPVPEAAFPFCPLSLILGGVPRTARSGQGRADFARRSGPLTARTVLKRW